MAPIPQLPLEHPPGTRLYRSALVWVVSALSLGVCAPQCPMLARRRPLAPVLPLPRPHAYSPTMATSSRERHESPVKARLAAKEVPTTHDAIKIARQLAKSNGELYLRVVVEASEGEYTAMVLKFQPSMTVREAMRLIAHKLKPEPGRHYSPYLPSQDMFLAPQRTLQSYNLRSEETLQLRQSNAASRKKGEHKSKRQFIFSAVLLDDERRSSTEDVESAIQIAQSKAHGDSSELFLRVIVEQSEHDFASMVVALRASMSAAEAAAAIVAKFRLVHAGHLRLFLPRSGIFLTPTRSLASYGLGSQVHPLSSSSLAIPSSLSISLLPLS